MPHRKKATASATGDLFAAPPGDRCACERCGQPCRVAPQRRETSYPFKLSRIPKGVCANCVVTEFLYNTYPINMQLDEAGPQLLLHPLMREAFQPILANCDLHGDEIDWARVVANWSLPVTVKRSPTNPYQIGNAKRAREAREAYQRAQEDADRAIQDLLQRAHEGTR